MDNTESDISIELATLSESVEFKTKPLSELPLKVEIETKPGLAIHRLNSLPPQKSQVTPKTKTKTMTNKLFLQLAETPWISSLLIGGLLFTLIFSLRFGQDLLISNQHVALLFELDKNRSLLELRQEIRDNLKESLQVSFLAAKQDRNPARTKSGKIYRKKSPQGRFSRKRTSSSRPKSRPRFEFLNVGTHAKNEAPQEIRIAKKKHQTVKAKRKMKKKNGLDEALVFEDFYSQTEFD